MELEDYAIQEHKIGYQTFTLVSGQKLKIFTKQGGDIILNVIEYLADKDYTVQIAVTLINPVLP